MSELKITDIGPIEELTIPVPEEGGVVVLRGRNGTGKTHALAAVDTLLGGKSRPASRDGSLGAVIEGLGARLTVARRASRTGEIEIGHLEGEDPSLLVDPGLKDAGAADAERVRALLRLARAQPDPLAFAPLVGGETELRELCKESTLEATDVPALAGAIKRDLEAAARKSENEAENLSSRAEGVVATLRDLVGDVEEVLEGRSLVDARLIHENNIRKLERAESLQESSRKRIEAADAARESLGMMGRDGTEDRFREAAAEFVEASERCTRLKEQLTSAEEEARKAAEEEGRQFTRKHEREALERSIAAAADAQVVPEAELLEMRRALEESGDVVERASIMERSAGLRADAKLLADQADIAKRTGNKLRIAAGGTEAVVTQAVAAICGEDMEIREGRLMVRAPRGLVAFCDLSQGERWRRALDIAVAAVGEGGLLVVRQEAWEGLDPPNRKAVAEHAKSLRTVIVTAQADEGEIRAEIG